ncbi:transporter [Streptomyces sp. NRRL F-5755]|uniref:MDR family MFS transporter n=1 Tax=Streptomyces sp. NRRL F-5755 TaxID=1519475 RepID=UPI0006AFBCF3|nr:MFS transporter [Streptomyces sp. NRRL F-5755]KOT90809.1 transporter [Streptomyces sp. NRRL F-5755]
MRRIPLLTAFGRALKDGVSGLPGQFWWLWTSTLVNRLGSFVTTFLALYLTVERGYSASYAGLVTALYGLGGAAASVLGGVFADRIGRRPTLLLSQIATALSTAALGLVEDPVAIAVVACVVGISSNASRPAVQAMIADLVPAEDRTRAFSLNYWAINIGFAVASSGAGLLARHGYQLLFLVGAGATLLCGVLVFVKLPETQPVPSAPAHGTAAPGQTKGLGTVVRDGRFMALTGLSFLIALLFQQGSTSLPLSMSQEGMSSTDYGLVISVNGLLIVLLQIPVTHLIDKRSPTALLVLSCLLCGVGWGLTAFAGSVAFYALTVGVWTLAEVIHSPTNMGLVVSLSPAQARGRYQGMYALAWQSASFVGPLLAGLAIDRFGDTAWWFACAAISIAAAAGYRLLRQGGGPTASAEAESAAPKKLATG